MQENLIYEVTSFSTFFRSFSWFFGWAWGVSINWWNFGVFEVLDPRVSTEIYLILSSFLDTPSVALIVFLMANPQYNCLQ
jgi:hypothetical protein